MIVFEYLHRMMGVFGPLMDEWANVQKRQCHIDDNVRKIISTVYLLLPLHVTIIERLCAIPTS